MVSSVVSSNWLAASSSFLYQAMAKGDSVFWTSRWPCPQLSRRWKLTWDWLTSAWHWDRPRPWVRPFVRVLHKQDYNLVSEKCPLPSLKFKNKQKNNEQQTVHRNRSVYMAHSSSTYFAQQIKINLKLSLNFVEFLRVLSVHGGCVCWLRILSVKWCQGRSLCHRSVLTSDNSKKTNCCPFMVR